MNRTALAAATAAVLLLLTGCTATEQPGPDASEAVASSAAPAASEAPLVAETPTATADGGEAAFLAEVRANLRPDNVIPNATDEQLLKAGREACDRRAAGEPSQTMSVIDGEQANVAGNYLDSGVIITAARRNLCVD